MYRFLLSLVGAAVVWFAVSAQQVAPEGYSSALAGIDWAKLIAAMVPIVTTILAGGKFDLRSILKALGIVLPEPAPGPDPVPVPTPVPGPTPGPFPLIRRFTDLVLQLLEQGRYREAKETIDLCESCCCETQAGSK